MKTFPILLKDPKFLIIGGGGVAYRKATVLKKNGIDFKVLSKEFIDSFIGLKVELIQKEFELKDCKGFGFVVDTTGSDGVSKTLLKNKNFLLCIANKPKESDFYFSSLLNYGNLKIAISSNGVSPTLTQALRDKIKSFLPDNLETFVQEIKREDRVKEIDFAKIDTFKKEAKLYLIGCGLGDVELLTIKAFKAIKSVDVVLYDHLISDEILEIVPKKVKKVFVGKTKGFHSISQERINELILGFLENGLSVGRLKSGDPYVFGRGAEEALAILSSGYEVEVLNGLSSSVAGVSMAGIPVTHRGYSASFSVVSAHLKDAKINLDWIDLLHKKNHTTVVLMGLSLCDEIEKEAIKRGVDENLKVAIVSNASRKEQFIKITTIKNLYRDSKNIKRPAVIVFGDVVKLHSRIRNGV